MHYVSHLKLYSLSTLHIVLVIIRPTSHWYTIINFLGSIDSALVFLHNKYAVPTMFSDFPHTVVTVVVLLLVCLFVCVF